MDQKETGIDSNDSNEHSNLDMELEETKKVKMTNENVDSSSSSTAANSFDSNGEDISQDGENPPLAQDDSKTSVNNEMDPQEEVESNSEDILFNLTPEEKALAQQIFGNHLTLGKILNNSSVHKLFDFRLVNKFWNKESTSVIMNTFTFTNRLTLEWNSNKGFYNVVTADRSTRRSLSELNSCISSSRRFPCSFFEIGDPINLECDDVDEFLRLQGEEIKSLMFDEGLHPVSIEVDFLREILVAKAPNIRTLYIFADKPFLRANGQLVNSGELSLFPKRVILPSLKLFLVNPFCSQISEIILSSPNLQVIGGDVLEAFDALNSMGKIHSVKVLTIQGNASESLHLLQKWAEAKPKLTNLNLVTPTLNMGKHLSKILDASRKSLKEMNLQLEDNFFNGVLWPKFENVESLSINCEDENFQSFSPNFITNVFPNITKLELMSLEPREPIGRFLMTATHLPCLKVVQIGEGDSEWLNLLVQAAPNVEELSAVGITDFYASAGMIWRFSKLKKLQFGYDVNEEEENNEFPWLDMAITGLSEEMVRKLHEDPVYFEQMKGQEIARVTPSILDCKALETLKLDFRYFFNREDSTLFTSVSGEFGFKLMSQLKVKFLCCPGWEGRVSSLAPYVEVKPYPLQRVAI